MDQIPAAMDRHLDVIQAHRNGGILLGASSLTGRYWLGSIWFYENPDTAPDVERCTAGVQLEAGVSDVQWVDNTKVLVALDTGGIELWNLVDNFHTFTHLQTATEHDDLVSSISISSNQKQAISGSHDRCIKVWDLEANKALHSYRAHADIVETVAYSPLHPDIFISTSQDNNLLLWDTRNSRPARQIDKQSLESCPTCACWKPQSEHIIAVGSETGELCVLDTRKTGGDRPSSGKPHKRPVCRVQFSPNKPSLLASVSDDCTVALSQIDSTSLELRWQDKHHDDFVRGLCWVNSDKLYTCSWDSTVKSHPVNNYSNNSLQKETVVMEVNGEKRDTTSPCMEITNKTCIDKVTETDSEVPCVEVASS